MNIRVIFSQTKDTKEIEIKPGSTLEDVLKKLNVKPDTVITISKNKPVPIDDNVEDGQELTIIKVASGG